MQQEEGTWRRVGVRVAAAAASLAAQPPQYERKVQFVPSAAASAASSPVTSPLLEGEAPPLPRPESREGGEDAAAMGRSESEEGGGASETDEEGAQQLERRLSLDF